MSWASREEEGRRSRTPGPGRCKVGKVMWEEQGESGITSKRTCQKSS